VNNPAFTVFRLASLLFVVLVVAGAAAAAARDDFGRPLGTKHRGPEILPRAVQPAPGPVAAEERATIDVFEQASRSVVFITNSAIRRDIWSLNAFEVPQGSGSGFVWNQSGHVVTNFHVVYGADTITVIMADRKEYRAKVVGLDPDHDLAVLQIRAPAGSLAPITVGTSADLKVGQRVLAIGNPFGLDHTLTTGVVSAIGRTIKSMTNRTIDNAIQTDAAINPGNSGGPLLDSFGRLIGINTQIVSPSGAYAGVGFAVPVDTVNRLVPELIAYGKIIRPGLGVALLPDRIAARLGIKGVVIGRVFAGGPAERAGLRGTRETPSGVALGDILTHLDGQAVTKADDLLTQLDRHKVGDRIVVGIIRDGHREEATLVLQAME
jgi:S1-C subfamily serine protease